MVQIGNLMGNTTIISINYLYKISIKLVYAFWLYMLAYLAVSFIELNLICF